MIDEDYLDQHAILLMEEIDSIYDRKTSMSLDEYLVEVYLTKSEKKNIQNLLDKFNH
jgi:hypothetical protein|tara:strand:- start:201 stop:371 length:171 start_codon:yes stop_codon:yes gene_type:complete